MKRLSETARPGNATHRIGERPSSTLDAVCSVLHVANGRLNTCQLFRDVGELQRVVSGARELDLTSHPDSACDLSQDDKDNAAKDEPTRIERFHFKFPKSDPRSVVRFCARSLVPRMPIRTRLS